ncbi:MAG: 3-deoxy-D-manno-octulosonic acid transferase [Candidatus Omnitrophota bacterium]|jgi:3-deoxy-D-manno-octulosonic-acid transferase
MFIIYDLIFLIFTLVYFPVYLFKRKFHKGFLARLGFLPKGLNLGNPVWIHAVSVGEAKAVRNLLSGLKSEFPKKKFVISTVTATGNKVVQSFAGENDFVTYLPLDFSFIVKAVIEKINPALFILAETEIWPNLLTCLKQRNIPVVVVNARISQRSFKGYAAIKFLIGKTLNKVSLFCAQTEGDKEKLILLGAKKDKVKVTGNLKFDLQKDLAEPEKAKARLKEDLRLSPEDKIFVAGSTHAPEEAIIIKVYRELLKEFKDLKLIVAPRHPERAKEVAGIASRFGFRPVFISQDRPGCAGCIPFPVFIVDVIGRLMDFYAIADIVFVGGSLIKKGGQNILEPATLAKPIIFGPHMFNFNDIAELYLRGHASILARSEDELLNAVKYLLAKPKDAEALGKKARELILDNQGATRRTLSLIADVVKGNGKEIKPQEF